MSDRYTQQCDAVNAIPESEMDRTAYIDVTGENELVLDGTFTVDQLKRILAAMESVP